MTDIMERMITRTHRSISCLPEKPRCKLRTICQCSCPSMPYMHKCGCVTEDGSSPYILQHDTVICRTAGKQARVGFTSRKKDLLEFDQFMKEHLDGEKTFYDSGDFFSKMRLHVAILNHSRRDADNDSNHREVDRLLLDYVNHVLHHASLDDQHKEIGSSILEINRKMRKSFWYS